MNKVLFYFETFLLIDSKLKQCYISSKFGATTFRQLAILPTHKVSLGSFTFAKLRKDFYVRNLPMFVCPCQAFPTWSNRQEHTLEWTTLKEPHSGGL
jgi:hypothetical protein